MKGTIDPADVQVLADKIICASHCTTFDTTAGPGATDPVIRKKVTEFLTGELNALLKAA
jgi:hypothetical protein